MEIKDDTQSVDTEESEKPACKRRHSEAQNRLSDEEQYAKLKAEVNNVGTAYLAVHYPELYAVYLTLEDFEKDEVRQYLRTYLFQREDDIGKFWTWVFWRTRDKRINWADFARLIGVNRTEITRKIRPQAIQAYAEALVKALKFFHLSAS